MEQTISSFSTETETIVPRATDSLTTEEEISAATVGLTSEGISTTEPEMVRSRIAEIPTTKQTSTSERFFNNSSGNTEAVIMQAQTNGTTN